MPPLSLERPARRPLLDRRRRSQHAGTIHVRPPQGPASGKGAAGKWTDAATGEHGDLLDVIRESCGLIDFRDVVDEARRFLSLPQPQPSPDAAQRQSAAGTNRLTGIRTPAVRHVAADCGHDRRDVSCANAALRLCTKPARCDFTRAATTGPISMRPTEVWPALIAAVTDLAGKITGAHRTWLDPSGDDKAPVDTPRRAMGHLLGHGVRFGVATDVMAAGEGLETMLSLRSALPALPMLAALSANHLAAILFPATLRRLYVARDRDPAGDLARGSPDRAGAVGRDRGADARRRRSAISTKICASSASMSFARPCASSSPRKTCRDSCSRPMQSRRDDECAADAPSRSHRFADRPFPESGRAHGLQEGDRTAAGPAPQRRSAAIFRRRRATQADAASPRRTLGSGFASRSKIAAARRPPLSLRPLRCGAGPVRPPSGDRREGRDGRGRIRRRTSP